MSVQELSEALAAAAEDIGPAVVRVGRGAGTVIATGAVLTNAHNLTGEPVQVRFADGRGEEAAVAAVDIDGDLAVVRVDTGSVTPPDWADARPTTGTWVLAVGPTRSGAARITAGHVSADDQAFRGPRGRRIHGAVEHTAPLGRGSSGGPIVSLDGRLLGINTHRRGDGFYLARPVDEELRGRVDALVRGQAPRTMRLGIAIAPPHVARRLRAAVGLEERDGLLIREVDDDAPAARAGLRPGDLLVAANGTPLTSPDELLERLTDAESVTLTTVRGVEEMEVVVSLVDEEPGTA